MSIHIVQNTLGTRAESTSGMCSIVMRLIETTTIGLSSDMDLLTILSRWEVRHWIVSKECSSDLDRCEGIKVDSLTNAHPNGYHHHEGDFIKYKTAHLLSSAANITGSKVHMCPVSGSSSKLLVARSGALLLPLIIHLPSHVVCWGLCPLLQTSVCLNDGYTALVDLGTQIHAQLCNCLIKNQLFCF